MNGCFWLIIAPNISKSIYRYFIWPLLHLQNTLDLGILFLVRYITLIYQFYACTRQKSERPRQIDTSQGNLFFIEKTIHNVIDIFSKTMQHHEGNKDRLSYTYHSD